MSKEGTKNSQYKHGDALRNSVTPEYRAWYTMKRRCYEPSFIGFHRYGGRGIRVCKQWLDKKRGYINFLNNVGRKPSKAHTLDRIKVNGNYTPNNVRWATRKEQNRNRRNTIYITYKGITKCLPEWAEEKKLNLMTLWCRLYKRNWSIEDAFETPLGTFKQHTNSKKTKCPQGHLYTGKNLIIEKNGNRRCRMCTNKRNKERWIKNNK